MTMLPLYSATRTCSPSHSQIVAHGGSRPKETKVRCVLDQRFNGGAFRSQASATTKSLYSNFVKGAENSVSDSHLWSSSTGEASTNQPLGGAELKFVEFSNLPDQLNESQDVPEALNPETVSSSLSNATSSFEEFVSEVRNSFNDSIDKGENVVKGAVESVNSSIDSVFKSVNEAVDQAVGKTFSAVDQSGELAGNKVANLSSDVKETAGKAASIAVDLLRNTIVAAENSVAYGASFAVYTYQSAKQSLPLELRDTLNLSEEKANEILSPVKIVLQKVYVAVEGLEGSLGLDPTDPLVPFVLVLGTSATLWVFYWVLTYGGYAGDLSPQSTLEILSGKEKSLLIDVRPEAVRERDGIPDLRRAARSRYTSVIGLEIGSSLRNSLRNTRELEDALTAIVIRNLKISQDISKFIILDDDGARSKRVARSLRKLGIKETYLVEGGFRSWAKEGLRIKELKPETALTILNEEAEAILENLQFSPVQILGYGLGLIVASYAVLEWESTLQYIAVLGLAQTVFRRINSYQSAEDFNKDVSQLLVPARLGGQAFSWAAAKLETNRNGLPTSPSSSDVQIRVQQAAAKHQSQPSDAEDRSSSEKVDLSEA